MCVCARGVREGARKPTSNFRLPASNFRLPISEFRLLIWVKSTDVQVQASGKRGLERAGGSLDMCADRCGEVEGWLAGWCADRCDSQRWHPSTQATQCSKQHSCALPIPAQPTIQPPSPQPDGDGWEDRDSPQRTLSLSTPSPPASLPLSPHLPRWPPLPFAAVRRPGSRACRFL